MFKRFDLVLACFEVDESNAQVLNIETQTLTIQTRPTREVPKLLSWVCCREEEWCKREADGDSEVEGGGKSRSNFSCLICPHITL